MHFPDLAANIFRTANDYQVFGFSVFCFPNSTLREVWEDKWQVSSTNKFRLAPVAAILNLNMSILPTFGTGHYTVVVPGPLTQSLYSALDKVFCAPIDVRYST